MADDTILQKVQKLVDKAWSTTFEAEKVALLAKADAMMLKYSIEQVQLLDPSRPNTAAVIKGSTPEVREVWYYGEGNHGHEFDKEIRDTMAQLFYALGSHFHVRFGWYGWDHSKVVGYPADLDFLEMMFLSLKMHMLANLSPTVTPDLSWEHNLAALKNAGFKWEDIHKKLLVHPNYKYAGQPWQRNIGVNFTAVYRRWCEVHPDEIRNKANPAQWRRSFVAGYVTEIQNRLYAMRQETLKSDANLPALIADRKSIIEEFFYEMFPEKNPANQKAVGARLVRSRGRSAAYHAPTLHGAAMSAGRRVAATADLSNPNSRISGNKGAINS
jgi:hypothetical protein